MKNLKGLLAISVIACGLLSGCGSSKQTPTPGGTTKGTTASADGLLLEDNECMTLQQVSPTNRAWGNAKDFDLSTAVALAEGDARAKMARAIATAVKAATQKSNFNITQHAGNETEGHEMTDGGSKQNSLVSQIANEVVENAVAIKTSRYILPNRQYNIYVCLEYQGGVSNLSRRVVEKVKQQISDEDRLKMEYEFQKFEKSVNEEIEKMKIK